MFRTRQPSWHRWAPRNPHVIISPGGHVIETTEEPTKTPSTGFEKRRFGGDTPSSSGAFR
ncbi:hypothetical protein NL676_029814, partial [Syzygium grande]